MINNEFHLIGVAISNFEFIGNDSFKVHSFRIEIEKFGAKAGSTFEIEVIVYGTNRAIDVNQDILGRQVVVNGYLDTYITKEEKRLIPKIIAQNLLVIEIKERKRYAQATPIVEDEGNIVVVDEDGDLPY